jgi:hypothetical protein
MAAGCPVQYCGTTRQKASNALADMGLQNAIHEYKWHQRNMEIAEQNETRAEEARRDALEQQMNAEFAAMDQRDCGPLNLGCTVVGDVAGGIGNAWAHTGGSLWNSVGDLNDWAWNHPAETLAITLAVTLGRP